MAVKQSDYEFFLADYCSREGAIALLRQYRPYLEKLPSLRRPEQSLITIPFPLVRVRPPKGLEGPASGNPEAIPLPCELAVLMCDPEWQVKLGAEILIFIHRPNEEFSELLMRWRNCQRYLDKEYEWLMPSQQQHMFSAEADELCPLFILFEQTPKHILKGIEGANLPFVIQPLWVEHSASESVEVPQN